MRLLKSHPLISLANGYLVDSPQPSNLSYLWNFGSLLGFCLVIQIVTGVTLAMHYNPSVLEAFNSVEHIMRDVNNGWLFCCLLSNAPAAIFFIVYLLGNYDRLPFAPYFIFKDLITISYYIIAIDFYSRLFPYLGDVLPHPPVPLPEIPDWVTPGDITGLGLDVFIAVVVLTGLRWVLKYTRNNLNLWLSPVLVKVGGEYKVCIINHLDREGRYLSLLTGNFFPFTSTGYIYIYISTPVGIYRAYITSHVVSDEVFEHLTANVLNRFSILDATMLELYFNRIGYNFLSSIFNVNLYSGFNCLLGDNSFYSNYHLSYDIFLLGASTIVPVPLPSLETGPSINSMLLPLVITPLYFCKNSTILTN